LNCGATANLTAVPLFPLPNLVLFPNALLPLHIFEERYKAMTADAIAGGRRIAMALLSPGWEKCYYGRPPIEPVVCVGTIVSYEHLDDGKFNFLLRGEARACIESEISSLPAATEKPLYRRARLSLLPETDIMEIDLGHERQRLESLLMSGTFASLPLVNQIRSLLRGAMPTAAIADLVAFHLLEDVMLKQSILANGDIRARVNRLLSALAALESPIIDQLLHDKAGLTDPDEN
jgi:Lon protease-like protein